MAACKICSKETKLNRQYCSPDCANLAKRKPDKECSKCGSAFSPIRPSQKYCSLTCFSKNNAVRSTNEPSAVPGAKWLALSQGKFALVDEHRYAELNAHVWSAVNIPYELNGVKLSRWYAKRSEIVDGKRVGIWLHRYVINASDGYFVDHINGDGLDNRGGNLRLATRAQNTMNSHSKLTNKYKGVYRTPSGTFIARIQADGKIVNLGTFANEEEAANVYDAAARKMHGQFARVNFPRPGEQAAASIQDKRKE